MSANEPKMDDLPETGEQSVGGSAKRSGMASLANDDFSVIDAIGGPRGVIESMLPGVVFVVLFVATRDLHLTVIVSAVIAVVQVAARLLQRQSVLGALTGVLAVGICLVWAWLSHDARNYYLPGFLINSFWIIVLAVSLLARIPGIGVLVEFIRNPVTEHFRKWLGAWRGDEPLLKAYMIVSGLWIGVFALRLGIQIPMYLTNHVGWLGTARLIMGVPLFALAIWISWLIIATPLHRHRLDERRHAEEEIIRTANREQ
ncbi:zinc ABC transporter permease [Bifidobacterium margollesii]|uniref:Zinc ABC transporter permease n=2 Tax=Bifidobacterium margollesii TaxID=2020964 RepID=A0A2N5J8H1_9BIFI|nr:zinc ABC transporter permease [Bifidobacterium margollesii]